MDRAAGNASRNNPDPGPETLSSGLTTEPDEAVSDTLSHYRKGLALTAIGGLAISVDIPLIRLSHGEPWSVLMVRTGTTLISSLILWAIWRSFSKAVPKLVPGWAGLAVAILYGTGSICFVTAVYNTSTANLVFLLAFTSMFAALLSWIFKRERPRLGTLITMAVMMVGILIIVGDSLGGGGVLGDVLALCSSLTIAAAITISRASGKDMGFAALVGVTVPFLLALIMVSRTGYSVDAPWWIIFNGAIVMPISFFCLAAGPKYLTGPEVAMFYLLETVLAPVWVWMIFSEAPTRNSIVGGVILIGALVAHSLWQWRQSRRKPPQAATEIRHPA